MLVEARDLGMNEVVIVCAADNTASARTIERVGGVLDDSDIAPSAPLRRYRVSLSP
jgi:predicted acetyltransferase